MRRNKLNSSSNMLSLCLLAFGLSATTASGQPEKIYWVDDGADHLVRADLDGSNLEVINGVTGPTGVAVDSIAGKVYVLRSNGQLRRYNIDGMGASELMLTSGLGGNSDVEVDPLGGKVYFRSGNKLVRANLDGTDSEEITTAIVNSGFSLDIGNGKIYFASSTTGNPIVRTNLDGSGQETVVSGPETSNAYWVAVDPQADLVFWLNASNGNIYRANIDGTGITLLPVVIDDGGLRSLNVDPSSGKIYITGTGPVDEIYRANYDGSALEIAVDDSVLGNLSFVTDLDLGVGGSFPIITEDPVSVLVDAPNAGMLSVTAVANELTYQWRREGVDLVDGPDVSGVNTPQLTIAGNLVLNVASYDCVVTSSLGSVASEPAIFALRTCPGDANFDAVVDVNDLVEAILNWGSCLP